MGAPARATISVTSGFRLPSLIAKIFLKVSKNLASYLVAELGLVIAPKVHPRVVPKNLSNGLLEGELGLSLRQPRGNRFSEKIGGDSDIPELMLWSPLPEYEVLLRFRSR